LPKILKTTTASNYTPKAMSTFHRLTRILPWVSFLSRRNV